MPDNITPPLGGVDDECGICGRALDGDEWGATPGYVALNGVICRTCTTNINHFTPRWYCLEPAHRDPIEVFEYSGWVDTPFYNGTVGGVFLDVEMARDSPALAQYYHDLTWDLKRLLWTVPAGTLPDGWTRLSPDWTSTYHLPGFYSYHDSDDDHPMHELQKHLPRPFAITGDTIIAEESRLPPVVNDLLSEPITDDAGQQSLPGASNGSDSSHTHTSQTAQQSDSGASDNQSEQKQTGLESFA